MKIVTDRGCDLTAGQLEGIEVHSDLTALLSAHWGRREDRYSELRRENTQGLPRIEMSHIGG
jgi:hypothetical protein